MRILIFGVGVIGSLYTVLLEEAGYDVSVYAWGWRLESLTRDGLLYKRKGLCVWCGTLFDRSNRSIK